MVLKFFKSLRGNEAPPKRTLFTVVSFFTEDNEYNDYATRLIKSLDRFQINYNVVPVRSNGVWEVDCARKARFILDAWNASTTPIVWLDADATVESYPSLFENMDVDFAIHRWNGWQFGSGTIYFGKSPAALKLLEQWVLRCEADPFTWDQTHLQSAWCDVAATTELRTARLPRSYLQIFDSAEEGPAIIKHWQASRKPKMEGRVSGRKQPEITERGMQFRMGDKPWRNPEDAFWITEGTAHIKPELGHEFPEGFDVRTMLREAVGSHWPILEIGCGVGRVASLFSPDEYIGVDVNPNAVKQARADLPEHDLRIFDDGYAYPSAPTALIYTVLLHVSDEALPALLAEATRGRHRFVIAEIMDRRWRRPGNPPVFNRDPEDYILAMQQHGFRLVSAQKNGYARYDQEPWNVGRDSRLTALAFEPSVPPKP